MNPTTPPPARPGAVPCHPAGTFTVLLFAIACAVAACDPDPALPEVRVDEAPVAALVSSPRRPLAAEAYIGDEYADVQRALAVEPGEAGAPTF
jgi:hypothetical protein